MRTRVLAALVTPQVLTALLFVIGALALLLEAPRTEAPAPVVIELGTPEAVMREQDAAFVVVDELGLERALVERMQLPDDQSARLTAMLGRLRELSMQQGVWPPDLPAPRAFVVQGTRGPAVIIDMLAPQPVGVSAEQEASLVRSMVATVQRNGVTDVRFLRNGRPTDTLLGHVAVASDL